MLSYLQSALIVLAGLLLSGLLIWIINRFWRIDERKHYNDIMGWQFGVLGTIYAVTIAFMLSSVWGSYTATSADVSEEASADLGVFRSAENLPKPYSDELRAVAIQYTRVVIDAEWPTMAKGGDPTQGGSAIAEMWAISTDMLKALPAQSAAAVSVRTAIRLLQDNRALRKEQYESRLPPIMWAVLICGGVLVVATSCLSGNERLLLHCFHVLSISFLILLMLTAVADLARPFEGGTSLEPEAFREVYTRMTTAVNPLSAQ
jgi:Protein of unknown function (DUF4239)